MGGGPFLSCSLHSHEGLLLLLKRLCICVRLRMREGFYAVMYTCCSVGQCASRLVMLSEIIKVQTTDWNDCIVPLANEVKL